MIATRTQTHALAHSRLSSARPARKSIAVRAEGGFDVDKFVEGLPAPVEYCYAGAAWGADQAVTCLVCLNRQALFDLSFSLRLFWTVPTDFTRGVEAIFHLMSLQFKSSLGCDRYYS